MVLEFKKLESDNATKYSKIYIYIIKKKNGYENKQKYPIYVWRNTFKRHFDLTLIEKMEKGTTFLSKILAH